MGLCLVSFWFLTAHLVDHNGQSINIRVHRLVLLAFVGPCPEEMECRHFPDKNPANNNLNNLQWGTKEENYQDKVVHGTHYKGEQNPNVILTEDIVKEIRWLHTLRAATVRVLAERFNVSVPNIEAIIYRKSWRGLP